MIVVQGSRKGKGISHRSVQWKVQGGSPEGTLAWVPLLPLGAPEPQPVIVQFPALFLGGAPTAVVRAYRFVRFYRTSRCLGSYWPWHFMLQLESSIFYTHDDPMNLSSWTLDASNQVETSPRAAVEDAVQHALVAGQRIDSRFRAASWAALLGQPPAEVIAADSAALPLVVLDLSNQRTIHVDAERTRQELPYFRGEAAVLRVERILTMFCQRTGVRYKQGLNELLAPLMMLEDREGVNLSDGAAFNLLTRVVRHFAPRFFASDDVDFISLQCSFRLFRLLALYHDPTLTAVLDQYELPPELFASPWFLTLFARNHADLEVVYALWDFLFACARAPGPATLHFVALAFLRSRRALVLDTARDNVEVAELPMKLSRLVFESVEDVRAVCAAALDLYAETPRSLRILLHNVCYSVGGGAHGEGGDQNAAQTFCHHCPSSVCSVSCAHQPISPPASRATHLLQNLGRRGGRWCRQPVLECRMCGWPRRSPSRRSCARRHRPTWCSRRATARLSAILSYRLSQ